MCFFLNGCGYHFEDRDLFEDAHTITIPYVPGDSAGQFTNELTRQLSASGAFRCVQNGGELILKVRIFSDGSEKIGFRYDRINKDAELKKRLVPVENRRLISAEVQLIHSATEEVLLGPVVVKADAEYDYQDPNSIDDLSVDTPFGLVSSVSFSLGQLDSIEGAQDAVSSPLYRHLAEKIVDGLLSQSW
jgi:outer membrane lipopolysaccharide assembly protein LptE/RlpB